MTVYFKAVRPDGTDFHTSKVDYGAALTSGETLTHPRPGRVTPAQYWSVSVSPTDCTGMEWPCRLLLVEPVGDVWTPDPSRLPSKWACHVLRVVGERPAHEALGPQGVHVAALVERLRAMSRSEADRLAAAWDAAWDAAWAAAGAAAWYAAWDAAARAAAWAAAARAAAWYAAGAAAGALVIRDLIGQGDFTQEHYDTLTGPVRSLGWRIHPDDPDLPAAVAS
jgi:hypothetical protein